MRNSWLKKVSLVVIFGGLLLVSWTLLVAIASPGEDPFSVIERKLDLIIAAISVTDLRSMHQNWDKKLDSTNGRPDGCNSDRFTCIFGDQAVRDNETGLVWDRSPQGPKLIWEDSVRECWQRKIGGRLGFRLPTIEELASLIDPSVPPPGPTLPPGHPFQNIQSAYGSVTTDVRAAFFPSQSWEVRLSNGSTGDSGKDNPRFVWCVRGGTTPISTN